MNRKQKIVLWLGIAAIVIMGIYPPWVCQRYVSSNPLKYITEPGPYSFMTSPPERIMLNPIRLKYGPKFIDLYRLGVQWCLAALITGGLIITLRGKKSKDEQKG